MSTTTCKRCKSWQPGHTFSAESSCHRFVELPAEQDPLEAHDLIDNIERDFMKNDHLMVTIHYDPIVTSDAAVGVLRSRLTDDEVATPEVPAAPEAAVAAKKTTERRGATKH